MSNPQFLTGSFVPTTQVWDVSRLYEIDVTSDEFKELLVRLYQNLNLMSIVLNSKDSGYYNTIQDSSGKLYFPNPDSGVPTRSGQSFRQGLRILINFGSLPNTGTKSVAHGITTTPNTILTIGYAAATDPIGMNYIPIPFASPTLANNIELRVDSTNVTIVTGSDRTAFTICYVVLEYLQF